MTTFKDGCRKRELERKKEQRIKEEEQYEKFQQELKKQEREQRQQIQERDKELQAFMTDQDDSRKAHELTILSKYIKLEISRLEAIEEQKLIDRMRYRQGQKLSLGAFEK